MHSAQLVQRSSSCTPQTQQQQQQSKTQPKSNQASSLPEKKRLSKATDQTTSSHSALREEQQPHRPNEHKRVQHSEEQGVINAECNAQHTQVAAGSSATKDTVVKCESGARQQTLPANHEATAAVEKDALVKRVLDVVTSGRNEGVVDETENGIQQGPTEDSERAENMSVKDVPAKEVEKQINGPAKCDQKAEQQCPVMEKAIEGSSLAGRVEDKSEALVNEKYSAEGPTESDGMVDAENPHMEVAANEIEEERNVLPTNMQQREEQRTPPVVQRPSQSSHVTQMHHQHVEAPAFQSSSSSSHGVYVPQPQAVAPTLLTFPHPVHYQVPHPLEGAATPIPVGPLYGTALNVNGPATGYFPSPSYSYIGPVPNSIAFAAGAAPSGPSESRELSRTNLYIYGLGPSTADCDLYDMCSQFGRVVSAKAILHKDTRECRGFGFVDFDNGTSAQMAVKGLNSRGIRAQMAKTNHQMGPSRRYGSHRHQQSNGFGYTPAAPFSSQGPPVQQQHLQQFGQPSYSHHRSFLHQQEYDPTNLYFANLPLHYKEQDLERMLVNYGNIVSTRILRDLNNISKGVGFARMETKERCDQIINDLNGTIFPGGRDPVLVKFADSVPRRRLYKGDIRLWRDAAEGGHMPYDPSTVMPNGIAVGPMMPATAATLTTPYRCTATQTPIAGYAFPTTHFYSQYLYQPHQQIDFITAPRPGTTLSYIPPAGAPGIFHTVPVPQPIPSAPISVEEHAPVVPLQNAEDVWYCINNVQYEH